MKSFDMSTFPARYAPLSRLNSICPYYTMFPLEFPYRILRKAPRTSRVLDPFCGRGTTLYAARLLSLPSVGIDSNPVAAAIAAAKLVSVQSGDVISQCEEIFRNPPSSIDLPEGDFWTWCYHRDTLIEICILREYLLAHCSTPTTIALRALLLGILHGPLTKNDASYLSNQMPRTYATKPDPAAEFWYSRSLRPPRINTLDVVRRRAKYIFEETPRAVHGRVIQGDVSTARIGWRHRFTHVITSPPYLGMRSYVPDQWLRNWFLGADEDVLYDELQQIGRTARQSFVKELAAVWTRIAGLCENNARFVVRFGALPSVAEEPAEIVKESFANSATNWKIETVREVPPPPKSRRQAHQFADGLGTALTEVDVYASLVQHIPE